MKNIHEAIALTIWWCEGTKIRKDKRWKNSYIYSIEVVNTNYKLLKIFIDYIVFVHKVPKEKIKGQIQIHVGDDKEKVESYWSNKLNISRKQFNKTIIRPGGISRKKNKWGTFKLRYHNKELYLKLLKLLDSYI